MSGHHQKRNGVPDRWLDYSAVGRRLDGTRFLAFKVPLKQALNQHLGGAGFGPRELLQAVGRQNQELGLIIDLTFTSRYYGLQDLPDSLQRLKILTAGRQVPADATILSFKRAVHRFLTENQHNEKLIGVHCTHGLNRTGYLICRYLIDVDGMEPERAVQLFNSSRGHAIERENYLEDLLLGPKRSNAGIEELEELPQWGGAAPRGGWEEGGPPHHPPHHHPHHPPHRPPHQPGYHRFFPPPGPPCPPLLPPPPLPPHRYTPAPPESRWRRPPPHQEDRRPPPHQERRPPPHQERRPPPHQEDRRPPPHQEDRRPPPHQEDRRRPPPHQEDRRRPPPHQEDRRPPPSAGTPPSGRPPPGPRRTGPAPAGGPPTDPEGGGGREGGGGQGGAEPPVWTMGRPGAPQGSFLSF